MLELAESTRIHRRITKELIYNQTNLNFTEKVIFTSDISSIYWEYKISESTCNIAKGINVEEIEVILITLKEMHFNQKLLQVLQKIIPYKILFVLMYCEKVKYVLYYTNIAKPVETDWLTDESLCIRLKGLNLDTVWENIVRQVARINSDDDSPVTEQLLQQEKRKKLNKEIEHLKKQIQNENQPNKKFALFEEMKKLQCELES